MNYTQFKEGLENGEQFSVYLFEGEDAFFRERGLNLLKSKLLTEPDLNYAVFLGETFNEKEVVASLSAYPFMSPKRLTVLREYYPKNTLPKELKEYIANPLSDSILVIVNEKPSEVLKKQDNVTLVDCKKADFGIIARYVKGKCRQQGVEIDLESAKTLAEYCLRDMTRVEGETEKLIAYAYDKKVITLKDIEEIVNKDSEFKIFDMTDYIAQKKFDLALTVITDMLSKGETMQMVLSSVYNYFRRLLHVAISDKTDAELATLMGVKSDFYIKKLKAQAKMFKKKSLKKAVDLLSDTDYMIKSGIVDAEDRIWHNIFTIITE